MSLLFNRLVGKKTCDKVKEKVESLFLHLLKTVKICKMTKFSPKLLRGIH